LTESFGVPPTSITLPETPACPFSVTVDKKYAEITSITLSIFPPGATCGGTLFFAEGLKSFFGPGCEVAAVALGAVVLKTNATECAGGVTTPTGVSGSPPNPPFPTGSKYACVNGALEVVNIPVNNVPLTFTLTGTGLSINTVGIASGTVCAGGLPSATPPVLLSGTPVRLPNGQVALFCPTGPGAGSIQACLAPPLPNNQPPVCSNTITFSFTQFLRRVVPQVRWAGEKIALTKCFGVGLAGSPVEFILKSTQESLAAGLLPTDLGSTIGATGQFPTSNTIWTVADDNGCASVLGVADGEGVMYVDAAIYSTTAAGIAVGSPIVNEHAFEVFYLKFDHLDLENINPAASVTTATALAPYSAFFTANPAALNGAALSSLPATFTLPSAPGANMEVAGPTGFSVPLCVTQFVRAMVHGYFEIPGDPSGRPATSVAIPGTPLTSGGTPSAGSFVLPAGRWVLPEDWPVLATFAGYSGGTPFNFTPSSLYAWDLNSGWVFNPAGELPVFCTGANVLTAFAPAVEMFGNVSPVDLGPCYGEDQAGTVYSTAPNGPYCTTPLGAGETVGFSGFDPIQSCTNPFPLTFTPAGATIIGGVPGTPSCPTGVTAPCLVPAGINSNYLPNGTLNQWDAPMPPAQISFGITGGFGFLNQVNKTGLYAITFDLGVPSGICPTGFTFSTSVGACTAFATGTPPGVCPSGATLSGGSNTTLGTCVIAAIGTGCATGFSLNTSTGTCQLVVNPNPFYATAIPASPFIPNITNNGGYLWNSWSFTAGTVTTVSSVSAVPGAPAGGFVPGQSTSVTVNLSTPGFAGSPAAIECDAVSAGAAAPYALTATGSIAAGTLSCTLPGGINITPCIIGATATTDTVVVANGTGFVPGGVMTLEKYSASTGATVSVGIPIQQVLASPRPGFPNAAELVLTTGFLSPAESCAASPFAEVFIGEQFGIPVPSAAAFSVGETITLGGPTQNVTVTIVAIDTTDNIIYVGSTTGAPSTATIAALFGPCTGSGSGISRAGGPAGNPFCEPNLLIVPGTLIQGGPVGSQGCFGTTGLAAAQFCTPSNPYPFWQWVPTPPQSGAPVSTSATVYSDNHGEAVVSLSTGITLSVAPINGTSCPSPYLPVTFNGTVLTCQLPLTALGPLGLANISTVTSAFSASKPGCIATFPSGTTAVVPTPASGLVIGATGPLPGQICINALGGIEFGTGAVLGSTTVQAIADYPYTRGEHPPIGSAPLTKLFTSSFAKSLVVSAGTPGPAGTTSYTVTITAKDICGTPLLEPIQISALGSAGAIVLSPLAGMVGTILATSGTSAVVQVSPVTGTATLTLEVLNTAIGTSGLVLKAVFPFEAIERFVTVIPGTTTGATVNVPYGPGWNMVGGPAGSNFSVAEALFEYDTTSGNYVNATASAGNISSAPPACIGYWAYFAAPMVVALPATSKSGDTAACTLKAGWNLVGNPFASPAELPSGVQGYHWNGTSYDLQGKIPVGGSVWIFETAATTLTLTAT
jgi:hypothetical protein